MQQAEDRVRRILRPAMYTYSGGNLYITPRGFEELARAVLDGRIAGGEARAMAILGH